MKKFVIGYECWEKEDLSMKKVVLVDICNTLADVNQEIEIMTGVKRTPGIYYHPCVSEKWFETNLQVFENASVIGGSVECINSLAQVYEIVYLTARPEVSEQVTRRWLKKAGFPEARIIFSKDKVGASKDMKVAFAIDDAPAEVEAYTKAGIMTKVPAWDYNIYCRNRFVYPRGGVCCVYA